MVPAQVWTTDWGQVATGRFGKAGEPARVPPRAPLPSGRCPLYDQARPATPLSRRFGAHAAPVKEAPSSAWTQMPRVLNSPSTAAPTAMQPLRSGRPGGRRGAMGADRARGWTTGKERLQKPARAALWTAPGRTASVIFGDRPRSEAAPIVDARRWRISRTVCPGVQADDHRIQAVESALSLALPAAG